MDEIRTEVFESGFARPGPWVFEMAVSPPRRLAGTGVWQVFFHDPNGAKVELDFAAAESGPR